MKWVKHSYILFKMVQSSVIPTHWFFTLQHANWLIWYLWWTFRQRGSYIKSFACPPDAVDFESCEVEVGNCEVHRYDAAVMCMNQDTVNSTVFVWSHEFDFGFDCI